MAVAAADIVFIPLDRSTWADQINTKVASGDIPDIIYRDGYNDCAAFARQGVLAEVPFDMVKQYAPKTYAATLSYGKQVWLACNVDGKNFGLPAMVPNLARYFTDSWRMDYLEKVGITKVPETLDEAAAAFAKIKGTDFDGNGKKDTYGLSFMGKNAADYMFVDIFSAFGVLPQAWMKQPDGTVALGCVTPEAKEALTLLNKWYQAGYIDPEFITTDGSILTQKIANGNVVYTTFTAWNKVVPGGAWSEALKAVDPNGKLVMGPALKGPTGKFGYMNWGYITGCTTFGKQLEKDASKLQVALQVMDGITANADLFVACRFGQEGTSWTRDANTNEIVSKAPYDDDGGSANGPMGKNFFYSLAALPDVQATYANKNEPTYYQYATQGNIVSGTDYFDWIGLFTSADIAQQATSAHAVADKWMVDFITGAKPLSQWDQYLKEFNDAGGAAVTADANKAYKNGAGQMDAITSQIN